MVRREYTEEFKLEAIKLVKETGQTIAKIGRDLGSVDKKYKEGEKSGSFSILAKLNYQFLLHFSLFFHDEILFTEPSNLLIYSL